MENELMDRKTIPEMFRIKQEVMRKYAAMETLDGEIDGLLKSINSYRFYDFRFDGKSCGKDRIEKEIDQNCWRYLIRLFNLERYMLCTEYTKMSKQIEDFNFPVFNEENAWGWLSQLKRVVYSNVQQLVEDVFDRITQGTYSVGSGWNNQVKKKRNNMGVDRFFILRTWDCRSLEYWSSSPTITDDLEKACYLLDGKILPDITIKSLMRKEKIWESQNPYFKIRVCKNGNTQYRMGDNIRGKLNLYGARKGVFGENIRIKVFEDLN